jgi:ketosteroid isomerase-like protein
MTKTSLKAAAVAASSLMLLGIAPASAGADAVRAEAYFNAISGGNVDTITSFYADDAEFHWVGGPLAGVYKGKDKIKGVWDRFTKAAGDLDHEVLQIAESANGKTSTVTARVKFKGEGEVPVKFIMVYKDGKIASEVWQVDKAGATSAKADGKPESAPQPQPQPQPKAVQAKAEPKAPSPVPPAVKAAPVAATPTPAPVAAPAPAARPAAPAAAERKLAQAPDQPPAELDDEPGGPEAEDRPEDADAPEADTAEAGPSPEDADTPPAPGRKAEIAPEKDFKPEPKLGGEPKLKAYDEKKPAYREKFEEKKVLKKKKHYGYGYDHDDYGYRHGWRGYGHGYGGYGHGYGGYGRGGYGHY